jgi:phenylpropionate dioxygenase-like ring-hydroxylating dioxygenase large terminal subunit
MAVTERNFQGDLETLEWTIPLYDMLSPEYFELERQRIFRRSWLRVGRIDDLPAPDSYFVFDVPTLHTSLLVTRDRDDRVQAFHNICKHRGNKLVRSGKGRRPNFTCGFHGWTYDHKGELLVITDENQFHGLDKCELGLTPVTTEMWEGHIFVNFDPQPMESLRQWLGPMYDQYDGYFDTHEKIASYQADVNANWHIAVNAFTEGYHTIWVHRSTAPDYLGGKGNPMRHRPSVELFEHHHRHSSPANQAHELCRAEEIAYTYGRKLHPAFDCDSSTMPPGVNSTRFDAWAFDGIAIFPTDVWLTGNWWRMELSFWPTAADRTLCTMDMYAYRVQNAGELIARELHLSRGREVFREDMNTLEATQSMLMSGVVREIHLSWQEIALAHHYRESAKMMHVGAPGDI